MKIVALIAGMVVVGILTVGMVIAKDESKDTLTTPMVRTATAYTITYIGVSVAGQQVTVDVEFADATGKVTNKQSVTLATVDYPQATIDALLLAIKLTLKAKGVVN